MRTCDVIRLSAKRLAIVAVVAAGVGCGGGDAPQRDVTIALESDIGGFNELVSADNAATQQVIERLYLDLFVESPASEDGSLQFRPRLAEGWETSEDGTVVTVNLRPEARWSDGELITADDVRWTWQAQTSGDVAWEYADIKQAITDVEVVNSHTLRFHFTHAYASQIADINEGVVMPRRVWSQLPFVDWREGEEWFRRHLVVSGPYYLEHYTPGSELVLAANPAYYERGLPRIRRLVFQVIPDPGARLRGLLAGDLDFIPKLRPHEAEQVESSADAVVIAYPHRQYDYIAWNVTDPMFAQASVRRALTQAIDRQEIIDTLLAGYAKIATSPIVSSSWAHADFAPWPHDPEAAVDALASAGWKRDVEGTMRDEDGDPLAFELTFNAGNAFRRDAAAMIQQHLRRIGVIVTLRPEDFNVLSERLDQHAHQAYLGGFNMDTTHDLTVILHSASIEDGYNFSAWADPEVDSLIERVKTYRQASESGDDLRRIQEILHHEQPMTFLWEPMRLDAHSIRLTNVVPNTIDSYANLREWQLVADGESADSN